MSNQRNADKDREIIEIAAHLNNNFGEVVTLASHWLERVVSAEQRVAELEALAKHLKQQWDIEREEHHALKGANDND